MSVENYVVIGITLATITVCCQLIFLPFLFSEIDSIRGEFDREIKEALEMFESSYKSLAVIRPSSIRREREAAKKKNYITADATSNGPADHRKSPPRRSTGDFDQQTNFRSIVRNGKVFEYEEEGDDLDYEEELPTLSPLAFQPPKGPAPLKAVAQRPGRANDAERSFGIGSKQEPTKQKSQSVLPMCPLEDNHCPAGPPGPPGANGVPGMQGTDGNDGLVGLDAIDELTPAFVTFCVTCPSGPEGKQGSPGPPGKPGLAGSNGIAGPSGKNGQPGASGDYGPPGKQGKMGIRGPPGVVGMDGVVMIPTKGPKGLIGKPGQSGQTGEDGTNNNIPGPQGNVGFPGVLGKQGEPGRTGLRGEVGYQGAHGENANCKCETLMKRAIEIAENTAYVALETLVRTDGAEIRRKPQQLLPTLEDVRFAVDKNKEDSFAISKQEDETVKKFAVAPSEVLISEQGFEPHSEENGELEVSASIDETLTGEKAKFDPILPIPSEPSTPQPLRSPPVQQTSTTTNHNLETASIRVEPIALDISNTSQPAKEEAGKMVLTKNMSYSPKQPSRAVLPLASQVPVRNTKQPRIMGESRRVLKSSTRRIKYRGEGGLAARRVKRVKRVNYSKARYIRKPPRLMNNDALFGIEQEIARGSDKKVVQREARLGSDKEQKNTEKATKNIKQSNEKAIVSKKLRRIELTPSKSLARQHQENTNILENIARSLGIIEPENHGLKRISIP